MADGMDRAFTLRMGIPQGGDRCTRCQYWSGDHECAFWFGRFTTTNWRCATLVALQQQAYMTDAVRVQHGVVSAVVADPNVSGGYALLTWQEGSPQRVSSALWFDTQGKATALTVDNAERLLDA